MHISLARSLRPALALLALSLVAAIPAQAKPVLSNLRVESGGKALDTGTTYLTNTTKFQTDKRPACGGSGKVKTLTGPTAMGILGSALPVEALLRPVGISDKFSFGLTVCGIGKYVGFGSSSFWLYKVNHKSPEVGADQYPLKPGDQVLWYFEDTATNSNTGNELALSAPARALPGKPFTVTVWGYDFNGVRTPVAGAQVRGDSVQTTDAAGHATITITKRHTATLRATHGADIASAPVAVCVSRASACPPRRGQHIVGTNIADKLTGTAGADRIQARGGADRISVAGGGADTVDCGSGKDVAIVDKHDRVAANCERVIRKR